MGPRKPSALTIIAAVLICVALVSAGMLIKGLLGRNSSAPQDNIHNIADNDWGVTVTYKDKKYTQKDGLTTVLLLGIDEGDYSDTSTNIGTAGRSDALILLVLDDKTKTTKVVTISRDTITDVDYYDKQGTYLSTNPVQINMQYAFGDSARRSCFLTKRTVGRLLHGRRIDGCASVTIDGIPAIADILGGITITFEEDYTDIDPAWAKGATVTLDGPQTERFIRYRDLNEHGSNNARMRRQEWLLGQLFDMFGSKGIGSLTDQILDKAGKYIENDIDADTIKKLSQYAMDPQRLSLPGKNVIGQLHDEFYVDDDALQQLLIDLFYEPA